MNVVATTIDVAKEVLTVPVTVRVVVVVMVVAVLVVIVAISVVVDLVVVPVADTVVVPVAVLVVVVVAVLKDSTNIPEPGLVVKVTKVLALGLGVSLVETTLLQHLVLVKDAVVVLPLVSLAVEVELLVGVATLSRVAAVLLRSFLSL